MHTEYNGEFIYLASACNISNV